MIELIEQWLSEQIAVDPRWIQGMLAALIFFVFVLARGIFTRVIFTLVLRLLRKTKTDADEKILLAFEHPLKNIFLALGLYFALLYLPLSETTTNLVTTAFRSVVVIFAAWGFYNCTVSMPFKGFGEKLRIDRVLIDFLLKILRVIIVTLAAIMIVQQWGFDVNGFIAGLGLGGLAFALAAKDAVANVFGGVVIILDKPFTVGDWIYTPSVEGTVEEISFRSTKVRTFAQALVTMPNSVLANEPITNWTRMGKRRITFNLGVTYSTPREKLKQCVERIRTMLETHPDIHQETIFVRFDQFNESSLDIFLYFFTVTTRWGEYLQVKEDVNFKIMEILEQEGVSVAFPSRSIYMEKYPNSTRDGS